VTESARETRVAVVQTVTVERAASARGARLSSANAQVRHISSYCVGQFCFNFCYTTFSHNRSVCHKSIISHLLL